MSQTDKTVHVPANQWTSVEQGNFKPGNVYVTVVSGSTSRDIHWVRNFCWPPFQLRGTFRSANTFPFLLCPYEDLLLFADFSFTVRVTSSA